MSYAATLLPVASLSLPHALAYRRRLSPLSYPRVPPRIVQVVARGLEIAATSTYFALLLLLDYVTGQLTNPQREMQRADQLAELLSRTGPTFIKVLPYLAPI